MPKHINILKFLFAVSLIGLVYTTYNIINTLPHTFAAPTMLADVSQMIIGAAFIKAVVILIPFIGLFFIEKLTPAIRYFMVFICGAILAAYIYNAWFIFNLSFEGPFLPDDFSSFHIALIFSLLWTALTINYFICVRALKKK